MYRCLSIAVVLVLLSSTAASGDSLDGTEIEETTSGLLVTAGSSGSLATISNPGLPGTGPTIYCGWFRFTGGFGSEVFDLVGDRVNPIVGHIYALNCWTDDRDDSYPGYPILRQYRGSRKIPGEAVSTAEVARFAVAHINFEQPVVQLSPPRRQVVGVPSWLAVTSRLHYTEVSANAGPVWATVSASFRDVTWDLGNGASRVCTEDVAKVWDPTNSREQTSRCTYTYTRSSGSPFAVTATVRWDIHQKTNLNSSWHRWGTITRSSTVPVDVTQLQSSIR